MVTRNSRALVALLTLSFLLIAAPHALGQGENPLTKFMGKSGEEAAAGKPEAAPSVPDPTQALEAALAQARSELAEIEALAPGAALPAAAQPQEVEEWRRLLTDLVRACETHIDSLAREAEAAKQKEEVQEEEESWTGFEEPPPFPIERVDGFRHEILDTDLELQSLRFEQSRIERDIEKEGGELKTAEREIRRITEALEGEGAATEAARLRWLLDLNQLRKRVSGAAVASAAAARRAVEAEVDVWTAERGFAKRKLDLAMEASPFTQEDLESKLERIARSRAQLQKELGLAIEEQALGQKRLAAAREALEKARAEAAKAAENGSPPDGNLARLQQIYETREVEYETSTIKASALRNFINGLNAEERFWKDRYAVAQEDDLNRINDAYRGIQQSFDQLGLWKNFFLSRLQLSLNQTVGQKQLLAEWRPEDGDRKLAEDVLASYEARVDILRRGLEEVQEVETLLKVWEAELQDRRERVPVGERIRAIFDRFRSFAETIWDYELFTLEDTIVVDGQKIEGKRAVTVSKILGALLILVIGLWLARIISRAVHGIATRRFRVEENLAALLDKGLYTVLFIGVVLFAVSSVQIPLTAFAFLGGALAIGAGFGAQNLINNFISGVILLLERPIKLGDIVDIEGVRGRVIRVGLRCSIVRRFDGIDMLIPNSSFLEKNVTNWTLSDPYLRFTVKVGVAYGSPTARVKELLEQAVREHEKIRKFPGPVVIFEEFGESSLDFTIYFWIEVSREGDYRVVASDLRFRIDQLLREAGITIAFPQRDVHLDSASPLQVEIVEGAQPGAGSQEKAAPGGGAPPPAVGGRGQEPGP